MAALSGIYEQFTLENLSVSHLNKSAATTTSVASKKHGYVNGNLIRVSFLFFFVLIRSVHLCGYNEIMKWYGGQSVLHFICVFK